MPRRCTVCHHAQRAEIDRALAARAAPFRALAARYGLSKSALFDHYDEHLPDELARAQAAKDGARADAAFADLERARAVVTKLLAACDAWLTDVEDPARYDLGPRAEDVTVTLRQRKGGREVSSKVRLSTLLKRIERQSGGAVEAYEIRHADPRELALKTVDRAHAFAELMAKVEGRIRPGATVNVLVASPEWQRVQAALVAALAPFPEARARVAAALASLSSAPALVTGPGVQ